MSTISARRLGAVLVLLLFGIGGCTIFSEDIILHDELFTYDIAYDRAFIKIINALNVLPNWRVAGTDQRAGKIIVLTADFMGDDTATLLIKRIDKNKTSVELDPPSQSIKGVEDLLKAIDKELLE